MAGLKAAKVVLALLIIYALSTAAAMLVLGWRPLDYGIGGIIAAVVAIILWLLFWLLPSDDVRTYKASGWADEDKQAKLAELRLSSRTSTAEAIGGLLLIATLALTAYQANGARKAADEARKEADKNLQIANDSQITGRFARAVEQLGASANHKPKLDVRVGALFALERISADSSRDTPAILVIVASYVRDNLKPHGPPRSGKNACSRRRQAHRKNIRLDVRIALFRILPPVGQRLEKQRRHPGFLPGMRFSTFTGFNLGPRLHFVRLNLNGSLFRNANLAFARFDKVSAEGVSFRDACLLHVDFTDSKNHFDRLDLRGTNLRYARVSRIFFEHPRLDRHTRVRHITVDGHLFKGVTVRQLCASGWLPRSKSCDERMSGPLSPRRVLPELEGPEDGKRI